MDRVETSRSEPPVWLLEAAESLYAARPADFLARRTSLAAQVASEHGKEAARAVTGLRKPSTAAWALNLLVRREVEQIDQVLALAARLREAAEALDGEELRALGRQRRQLTGALTTTARRRAAEAGTRLSDAVADQVESMLTAAMIDPVAGEVVRTGRVLTGFSSTGVSSLDPAAVVALPAALEHRARALPEPGEAPELRLVAEDPGAAAETARREAEEELQEVEGRAEEALVERDALLEGLAELDARRLQLQGEAEELRRQLAEIDQRADEVEEEHEETSDALHDAEQVLEEARAQVRAAQARLARLP